MLKVPTGEPVGVSIKLVSTLQSNYLSCGV
jgi:hypothetical protein